MWKIQINKQEIFKGYIQILFFLWSSTSYQLKHAISPAFFVTLILIGCKSFPAGSEFRTGERTATEAGKDGDETHTNGGTCRHLHKSQ